METLGPLIHGVAKTWREALDRRLRPLGLSRAKWLVLLYVSRDGGTLTQRALAEKLEVGAPAMVALVDRMEREGLVRRIPVPGDRRMRGVSLTAESRRLIRRIEAVATALRLEILDGMSQQEMKILSRLLEKTKTRIETLP